jgi:AcrR family transcriptional regulator
MDTTVPAIYAHVNSCASVVGNVGTLCQMATPPDAKKRTRLQPDERRGRIVETALEPFARLGLDASMADLAAAAGVTRPAVYHYFPGKLDLFLEVAEAQTTELLRYIAPAASMDDDDRARLRAIGDAILRFAEEHPQGWRVLFEHLEADAPALADIRARVHEVALTTGFLLFPEEAEILGLTPDTIGGQVMTEMIVGSITAVVRWWHAHPDAPRENVLDGMVGLMWNGIGGLAADGRRKHRRAERA